MSPEVESKRNKAERLAIAGAIAPVVRQNADKLARRRINVTHEDGSVSYISGLDYQKKIQERARIEFDVQLDARPTHFLCKKCGETARVGRFGVPPSFCKKCLSLQCVDCGVVMEQAGRPEKESRRRGPPRCRSCKNKSLRVYEKVSCVCCGKPLSKSGRRGAGRCSSCFQSRGRKTEPCTDCGCTIPAKAPSAKKEGQSVRCRKCAYEALKKEPLSCSDCGTAVARSSANPGRVARRKGKPIRCQSCAAKGRARPAPAPLPLCVDCGKELARSTMSPSQIARRKGRPPRCHSCGTKSFWSATDTSGGPESKEIK